MVEEEEEREMEREGGADAPHAKPAVISHMHSATT